MTIERALRLIAGTFVLTSLTLSILVHPAWQALGFLVALNLIQSGFTDTCPMVWLLRRLGLPRCGEAKPML